MTTLQRRYSTHPRQALLAWRTQAALGIAALFSGAALIVSIEMHVNLGLTLLLLGAFSTCAVSIHWLRADHPRRAAIRVRFVSGVIAGSLATLGYDGSRFLIVSIGRLRFDPFHALPLFGYLILGQNTPLWAAWVVGTCYHYLNGIAFAVAYSYLLGKRDWRWAIVWALSLEALMFTIYPGWLDLKAVMAEFTAVSCAGHVVYGAMLGAISMTLSKKIEG